MLSSFYEGFPNVLLRSYARRVAMYFDKMCECGPSELINDGKNDCLVQIGNVDQMTEKIITLVENETLRRTMGEEAKGQRND